MTVNAMIQDFRDAHIMVVDDAAPNLKLVEKILNAEGYLNVELVQNPLEVVDRYRKSRPDLILLDINMPQLNGFGVMEQLHALNDPLRPPILILTAQHGKDYLLKSLDLGARDFLTKPFDRAELLARVRNLLEAQLAHRLVHDQKAVLEEMVHQRTEELRRTRLQIVQRLGRAAEYRDNETGYHILRMSHISVLLGRELGMDSGAAELLLHASPMHDIGKIGIPDDILLKPGKLTTEEFEIMKTHTTIGAEILTDDDSDLLILAREIALTHHEKWDGNGYPNGLAGEDIPIAGRICAVADVFDALTSERPYKKAWPIEEARDFIVGGSGSHFDPQIVSIFDDHLDEILAIRDEYREPEQEAF